MIKYVDGNILTCDAKIRCHQVNCFGIMDAGLAKQIKLKYPEIFNFYRNLCYKYSPEKLLGTVHFARCHDKTIIANMFSQKDYGNDGKVYTDYTALDSCIEHVYNKAKAESCNVAFPYFLGCGYGGGDWNEVEKVIKKYFDNSNIECLIVKLD